MKLIKISDVSALEEDPTNVNVMDPDLFTSLIDSIKNGFWQPLLVRELTPGKYRIVDGHHRYRAAQQAGVEIYAVVAPPETTDAQAKVLQIGMNRLRGELDLAKVAKALDDLLGGGMSMEDLHIAGFKPEEIEDLIQTLEADSIDEVLKDANTTVPEEEPTTVMKPFLLELTFRTKDDLKRAKKGLKHAAGKNGDMADGLLRILGET